MSVTLHVYKNPNLAVPWFNDGVAKENPLISCSVVVELSTGKVETIYAGNCFTKMARKQFKFAKTPAWVHPS
jgi:hypothetical protein